MKPITICALAVAAFAAAGSGPTLANAGSTAVKDIGMTQPTMLILLARNDDRGIDRRHGRGGDDGAINKRGGADDPAGDNRRGRGRDGMGKSKGADDPPGDLRHGRGRDDLPGDVRRGRGRDDPPNHG